MENNKIQTQKEYNEASIRVLEGLEAVRERPAMYIGDTSERGLHHLINEVVDNSIDEALAGYCTTIIVTLHADGSCSVKDNGRGIPTGEHPIEKKSTLEVVLCTLHAGGKFDNNSYKVSGGLHGVGVSCVNALSIEFEATVERDGQIFQQHYSEGKPLESVHVIGKTRHTGTTIKFKPDNKIFNTVEFKYKKVADRLRELAFLNSQVKILLKDERTNTEECFHFEGGLKDFVNYIDSGKTHITKPISIKGKDANSNVEVDICFQYNTEYKDLNFAYANNIHTIEGGTHVSGFKIALTKTLNTYIEKENSIKKGSKIELVGDDFREGMTSIISVKLQSPQFEGQTKTKLGNSEIENIVRQITSNKLQEYLDFYPNEAKVIIDKAVKAAEARLASKKARELVRRKNELEGSNLPGKLSDCTSKNPAECELFIVEGNSAGGSAKQGRNSHIQAILPLRGKILNVQKALVSKILENEEIKTMISAIGAGFSTKSYNDDEDSSSRQNGKTEKEFDISKIRYNKIIIMSDADVDGAHIQTLLLTFFFNYMRDLITNGNLYIASPPLYRVYNGKTKTEEYAWTEEEKQEIAVRMGALVVDDNDSSADEADEGEEIIEEGELDEAESAEEEIKKTGTKKTKKDHIKIQRFKGLGEMNPEQLWSTTMDPETRKLKQVVIEDAIEAEILFNTLMGDNVLPRREFIEQNAQYAELDV